MAETMVSLKDITPSTDNNINTRFIVLEKAVASVEHNQKVCLALVADETASVHFKFWGDECDAFQTGDIIQLVKGIFSNQGGFVLRAGMKGKTEKVGEFTMLFVETPNMSEINWVPFKNSKKYVQEAVKSRYSQIFPPMP